MSKEIKIGILAIVAFALLFWGYRFLMGTNLLQRSSTFYVEYENVDNLQISDPVFIKGYKVGTVKNVYIEPNDLKNVVVVLDVDRKIRLPKNVVAELKNGSLMGGKQIDLIYQGTCSGADCVKNGDKLNGKALGFISSLMQPNEIDLYMMSLQKGIGGVIDSISNSLTSGDPEEGLGKTIADLRIAVANLKNSTILMNQLFANSSDKLVGVFDNLESVTGTLKDNNDQITGLLKNTNEITKQLSAARLDTTIFKANRALGSTNDAITSLQGTLEKADLTFSELQSMLKQINSGEGTMGLLMSDKELYDNLTRSTKNLELLLQDFRLFPKRYVNVSVFGKKHQDYEVPTEDPAFEDQKE